jgi:Ca-activated chloride channel family protein
VTDTALAYQLLSQYTAFVAVSDDVRVEPGTESISVNVPVEMPEAVEYEGVFGNTDNLKQKRMAARSAPAAGSMRYSASAPAAGSMRYSAPAAGSMQYFASDEEDLEIEDVEIEDVEIEGDISFSLADMVFEDIEELEPSKARPRGTSPVEVVSAAGLDEVAIDSLNEHLATLTVPPGINGELVLEIVFSKVRASRIVVDADASTLADVELLEIIKKWLFSWRIPHSIGDTVRLTLRVRS